MSPPPTELALPGLIQANPFVHHVSRAPAGALYIGRSMPARGFPEASVWANPVKLQDDTPENRLRALYGFRNHLYTSGLFGRLHELRGQHLKCWCSPALCHGHLLHAYADRVKLHGSACPHCTMRAKQSHWDRLARGKKNDTPARVQTLTSSIILLSHPDGVAEYWRCPACASYGFESREPVTIENLLKIT